MRIGHLKTPSVADGRKLTRVGFYFAGCDRPSHYKSKAYHRHPERSEGSSFASKVCATRRSFTTFLLNLTRRVCKTRHPERSRGICLFWIMNENRRKSRSSRRFAPQMTVLRPFAINRSGLDSNQVHKPMCSAQ